MSSPNEKVKQAIRDKSEFFEKTISRAEMGALFVSLLAFFLIYKKINFAGTLLAIGLSLLSLVYMLYGFFLVQLYQIQHTDLITKAIQASYFALAVATTGLLFGVQFWPGGEVMLYTGALALITFIAFLFYKNFRNETEEHHRQLINNLTFRILPVLLIAGFLILSYK